MISSDVPTNGVGFMDYEELLSVSITDDTSVEHNNIDLSLVVIQLNVHTLEC